MSEQTLAQVPATTVARALDVERMLSDIQAGASAMTGIAEGLIGQVQRLETDDRCIHRALLLHCDMLMILAERMDVPTQRKHASMITALYDQREELRRNLDNLKQHIGADDDGGG